MGGFGTDFSKCFRRSLNSREFTTMKNRLFPTSQDVHVPLRKARPFSPDVLPLRKARSFSPDGWVWNGFFKMF